MRSELRPGSSLRWCAVRATGRMTSSSTHNDSTGDDAASAQEASLRALYEAHGSFLLGDLLGQTRGDWYKAEEILQETLLRACQHLGARSVDGEWSRPWLITVARRIAVDHMRSSRVRQMEHRDEHHDDLAKMSRPIEFDDVR